MSVGAGGVRIGERHGEVLESRLEAGIAENVPRWEEWLFACLHRLHTLRDLRPVDVPLERLGVVRLGELLGCQKNTSGLSLHEPVPNWDVCQESDE